MSRFLLLFLFLVWVAWQSEDAGPARVQPDDLALFFGFYGFLVGILAIWARMLARRVHKSPLERSVRYFNQVIFAARILVLVWFGVGVFYLGWGRAVQMMLGPLANWPVQLPGTVLGTLPALLTWAGLWWAQFPADAALREQNLLVHFDNELPIFRPPTFWSYLLQNLRLQILFTAVPIFLILLVHDVAMLVLWRGFRTKPDQSALEGIVTFLSALGVFIIVPEILARVLPTQSLPASSLRDRMEALARLHGLKFRDILLWRTDHRIANALVMGIVPRFRYVLLSDLLLEEMTDEQIEAVFAHEVGHVVHKHLIWYLVFIKVLILVLAVVALIFEAQRRRWQLPDWMPIDLLMTLIGFGGFLAAFGYVSRRFERQADVFAARTIENSIVPTEELAAQSRALAKPSHVGPAGASAFASALHRVAIINNMPLEPRRRWEGGITRRIAYLFERIGHAANTWLHGSIALRMRTLHHMSADPAHTRHFDRRMARLYLTIILALVVSGALAWLIRLPIL